MLVWYAAQVFSGKITPTGIKPALAAIESRLDVEGRFLTPAAHKASKTTLSEAREFIRNLEAAHRVLSLQLKSSLSTKVEENKAMSSSSVDPVQSGERLGNEIANSILALRQARPANLRDIQNAYEDHEKALLHAARETFIAVANKCLGDKRVREQQLAAFDQILSEKLFLPVPKQI